MPEIVKNNINFQIAKQALDSVINEARSVSKCVVYVYK